MKLFVFPANIEQDILDLGARQVPYMRTPEFSKIMLDNEHILKKIAGCGEGRILFFTSSGTGAMDAVVAQFVGACRNALVVSGGTFGQRWKDLCDYYKIQATLIEPGFGQDLDIIQIDRQLKKGAFDVVLTQHHETSSGQLHDIKALGQACHTNKVLLVVDAIGSVLADPFDMDQFGVDVMVLSSQKGLCLPPGISFVLLGRRALEMSFRKSSFYFDFSYHMDNLQRGQTPWSPATSLFLQLHKRLKGIEKTGVDKIIKSTRKKAERFRELLLSRGFRLSASTLSNALTGVYVRGDATNLFHYLAQRDMYVMLGSAPDLIRVTHVGCSGIEDHEQLLEEILLWQET